MTRSSLFGRRIHIAGSVSSDPTEAPAVEVARAREFVTALVPKLVKRGATFVVPVDAEKQRPADQMPICFDWLVWEQLAKSIPLRPAGAPDPLAVAVQHHKTEAQVPAEYVTLWDGLRGTDLVQIENVSHWNMASRRLEAQARWGDLLLALGGSEGTLFLANLYHDVGKPVVPLDNAICAAGTGARRIFALGLSSTDSSRLFRPSTLNAHAWMNRVNFAERIDIDQRVETVVDLLEALEPRLGLASVPLDPSGHQVEHLRLEMNRTALGVAAAAHQPGLLEHLEVLRDRLKAHLVRLGQLADGRVGHGEPRDQIAPGGIGECRERPGEPFGVVGWCGHRGVLPQPFGCGGR